MNRRAYRLLATLFGLGLLIAVAVQVAGQGPPRGEWVVFTETGYTTQAAAVVSSQGATMVRTIPAFNAHVIRASESEAGALRNQPGIRKVVPNFTLSVGPGPAPGELATLGDVGDASVQGKHQVRVTPNASAGRIEVGTQAVTTLRLTNTGFAPLNDLTVLLEVLDMPQGTSLTTGAPGQGEYRVEWRDPVSGQWTVLEADEAVELPAAFSILIADQQAVEVRVTLGSPGPRGAYSLAHSVDARDGGGVTAASTAEVPWYVRRVNAQLVWPETQGQGVKVAVLDTGIAPDHVGLTVVGGCNAVGGGVEDCEPEGWEDDNGHGTSVAALIASDRSASGLFNGVAPKVDLYSVKVCDSTGSCKFDDILDGLAWAMENEIQVVNMSFGTENPGGAAMCDAFEGITDVVFVAASGNSVSPVNYPAACEEVIAAGSTDADDGLSSFSSRGPEMEVRGLIAPGQQIFTLHLFPQVTITSGTSFSSPIAAGAAALLLAGGHSPAAVFALLAAAAEDLGMPGEHQGAGMVDVFGAWNAGD